VVDAESERHVFIDRLREWVRLLKDHAYTSANLDRVHVCSVEVEGPVQDAAFEACAGDEIVHPVEAPQQCALPAPRGTDQCGHVAFGDIHRHARYGRDARIGNLQLAQGEDRPRDIDDGLLWERYLQFVDHEIGHGLFLS
jgi:hypothetical protein